MYIYISLGVYIIRLLNRGGVLESTRYTPYTLTLGVREIPGFQLYPTFFPYFGSWNPVAYRPPPLPLTGDILSYFCVYIISHLITDIFLDLGNAVMYVVSIIMCLL